MNEVHHEKQYGFRENCTNKLIVNQVVNELIEACEKKLINCSVFLDLAKTFTIFIRKILKSKLKSYNIKGSMFNLL